MSNTITIIIVNRSSCPTFQQLLMTLSTEYVFGKLTNQIHQFKFVPIRLYLTASFIYCEGFRSGMNVVLKIDL